MTRPRQTPLRTLIFFLCATVIAAIAVEPAVSATVHTNGETVYYTAQPGEKNDVRVTAQEGLITITELGVGVPLTETFESPCEIVGQVAQCVLTGSPSNQGYWLMLGDLDDIAQVQAGPAGTMFNQLDGGTGSDTLTGGPGSDQLRGGEGDDVLNGMGGDDGFIGEEGADAYAGGAGRDNVTYSSRNTSVTVTLDGTADDGNADDGPLGQRDNVWPDVEQVQGGTAGDVIVGSPLANFLYGYEGNDTISGGDGNDDLGGGGGSDVMNGDGGDDTFEVGDFGGGADTYNGGLGIDLVTYKDRFGPVLVDLDGQVGDDGAPAEGDTVGADVEDVMGGDGDDVLVGNASDNWLRGDDGADTLEGLGGDDVIQGDDPMGYNPSLPRNDTLRGGGGDDVLEGLFTADLLEGGDGFDVADYSRSSFDLEVDLDGEVGDDGAWDDGDTIELDVEGVWGGSGEDILIGNGAANLLDGGDGHDFLDGGLGPDELIGGDGVDFGDYSTRSLGVSVDIGGPPGNDGSPGEGDTVDPSVEVLNGGDGNDALTGDGSENLLFGGRGNDDLRGAGGDDLLNGGLGGDSLAGGAGFDLADYLERSTGVSADLDGAADDGEPGEGDAIAVDVEDLRGGDGNDNLVGNGGENFLFGQGGNDSLNGGAGSDLLVGGDGDDDLSSRDNEFVDENDCGFGSGDRATIDWFDDVINCEQAVGPAPHVATGAPSEVTQTTARLSAAINSLGSLTAASWELGTTTAYGRRTPSVSIPANGWSTMVSTVVTGLTPGTTYHYRSFATNGGGTTYGVDLTFTTLGAPTQPPPPPPPPPPPARPCVVARVVGQPLRVARRLITKRRCRVGKITRRPSRVVRKGRVLAQRPKAGRRLPRGSKVSLVVSSGKPRKPRRR